MVLFCEVLGLLVFLVVVKQVTSNCNLELNFTVACLIVCSPVSVSSRVLCMLLPGALRHLMVQYQT
jgi:hypothetical protein